MSELINVYENGIYGFEIRYPKELTISEEEVNEDGATVQDIDDGFIISTTEDNMESKVIAKVGAGSINMVLISYNSDSAAEYENTVNQIISSFKV